MVQENVKTRGNKTKEEDRMKESDGRSYLFWGRDAKDEWEGGKEGNSDDRLQRTRT